MKIQRCISEAWLIFFYIILLNVKIYFLRELGDVFDFSYYGDYFASFLVPDITVADRCLDVAFDTCNSKCRGVVLAGAVGTAADISAEAFF